MIRLSRLTDPVEVDLSKHYPGFKVTLKRLTAMDWQAATSTSSAALNAAKNGLAALADYGLDRPDANGVRLSPLDLEQMTRAGYLVGCVELCMLGILNWEGVELEDGAPAPINRETLSILLQDFALSRALLDELTKAARILISEGEG